ncbi:MAG: hypothetical protein QGF09_06470, partial [Rhodospirillales bacterium]|nr:hypothetical protein [Rhodospirillales bacterium]
FVKKYTKDIYKTIHHRLIKYNVDFLYHEEDEIYTSFFLYLFENNYIFRMPGIAERCPPGFLAARR